MEAGQVFARCHQNQKLSKIFLIVFCSQSTLIHIHTVIHFIVKFIFTKISIYQTLHYIHQK